MKYFEIMVVAKNSKSYYEGNFYIEESSLNRAVNKVAEFLEIDDNFEIYTKELSKQVYLQKLKVANKKSAIKNSLLQNSFSEDFGLYSFDKITSTKAMLELVDLSMF